MSDLVVSVRQIANYPNLPRSDGSETLLAQVDGLGGPYASIQAATLVSTALNAAGPMGVGETPPVNASVASLFAGEMGLPSDGALAWNAYVDTSPGGTWHLWTSGSAASLGWDPATGFEFATSTAGAANDPLTWSSTMFLNNTGNLELPYGTLTVARDPSATMEVTTMQWVARNTVASFNARTGPVTLTAPDIYQALGYTDYIATQSWVINAINAGISNLITTHPFVFSFNTRMGDVTLQLQDISTVFLDPRNQPVSQTPPPGSNDDSIATTSFVASSMAALEARLSALEARLS